MKVLKKVPAGIMVIPLFLAAFIHTFFPEMLEIGSFTTATFSNSAAATIMGVQLVCLGSKLKFSELPAVAKRGGVLLLSKFMIGLTAAVIIGSVFGKGGFLGISLLALISAITNTNGSIYLSLMSTFGDEKDCAAVPLLAISNGPFLTLVILGVSGFAKIPIVSLCAALVPIIIGMILGNWKEEFRTFLEPGIGLLLPFIGFSLGAGIDLKNMLEGGVPGILLGLVVLIIGGGFSLLFDKFVGRQPGHAGLASGATGANAVAVPAAVALMDPTWNSYIGTATTQVAAAVVICAVFIPLLTEKWVRYVK